MAGVASTTGPPARAHTEPLGPGRSSPLLQEMHPRSCGPAGQLFDVPGTGSAGLSEHGLPLHTGPAFHGPHTTCQQRHSTHAAGQLSSVTMSGCKYTGLAHRRHVRHEGVPSSLTSAPAKGAGRRLQGQTIKRSGHQAGDGEQGPCLPILLVTWGSPHSPGRLWARV